MTASILGMGGRRAGYGRMLRLYPSSKFPTMSFNL